MDIFLIILAVGALSVVCFFFGAKVGQTASRGEEIKIPNPIDAAIERHEQREARREERAEAEKLDIILENIANYNGTGNGQKNVPRG